ncbi:Protein of unknown function [Gryllus bimaculatus]|nr:Protein of unknown function [Gryllus bimaculatus]
MVWYCLYNSKKSVMFNNDRLNNFCRTEHSSLNGTPPLFHMRLLAESTISALAAAAAEDAPREKLIAAVFRAESRTRDRSRLALTNGISNQSYYERLGAPARSPETPRRHWQLHRRQG